MNVTNVAAGVAPNTERPVQALRQQIPAKETLQGFTSAIRGTDCSAMTVSRSEVSLSNHMEAFVSHLWHDFPSPLKGNKDTV